jgi:DNA polymerase III delta prime subunit
MSVENLVWVEAYRPHTIEECILPKRLKTVFQGMVDTGAIQNMTLVGGPGMGKTTVARALCEQMGWDYIIINASEERNIDTIRTTVRQYGSTISVFSEMKCIILDEADHLNAQSAQPALRGVIEEFMGNCRFILTANYGNKLIEPLLSRCPVVDFSVSKSEKKEMVVQFAKRLKTIMQENEIEFDPDQLIDVVLKNFPDFRKTLNLLQRYSSRGRLDVSHVLSMSDEAMENLALYLREKDFGKMRKWVVEHLDNDGVVIRRSLYDKAFDLLDADSIPELILLLNKYDYQEGFCADREINTVAMLTECMASLVFK